MEWKISNESTCIHCNKTDNVINFLIDCPKAKEFWKSLIKWWNRQFTVQIEIQINDIVENIIFGFMANDSTHKCMTFIFLYAKCYIIVIKNFKIIHLNYGSFIQM